MKRKNTVLVRSRVLCRVEKNCTERYIGFAVVIGIHRQELIAKIEAVFCWAPAAAELLIAVVVEFDGPGNRSGSF